MMPKEEKVLCALHGIKSVLNDLGLEDIKNKLELKDGSTETIDCVNVLQEFIVDYVKINRPYKFEDLKEGMWVWDDEWEEAKNIRKIQLQDCFNKRWICFTEGGWLEFEEGRFFQ